MSLVSVIVPSYNLGQYLGETLKSVMNQTFTDWECLIVENGSTDGSLHVVNAFCDADSRFVPVVFSENMGVAAARNRGVELAEGKYILFLDADDLIAPHYMADAVAALEADAALSVVYGKGERFGAETTWDLPPFSMETMLASNCLYISCFFRKADAAAFDPAFKTGYEDWDFWLSLLENVPGEPGVLQLPSVCFYYRTRKRSRNRGVTDEALKEIRRRLWEKHKGLYARYFCDPLQTVEYRRLQRSFRKASRWSLAWKLRLLFRKLFS
ncbi:MAG: glycosyltransferase family 2 protein [Bacteroidales bacterium]|nr:glycosyltransferase family 2 protein [Bacteroidales bacterium]